MTPELVTCPYGDPTCPCPDGLWCHYEGPDPMTPPARSLDMLGRFVPVCLGCGATVEHVDQWQVFNPATNSAEWPYCRECYYLHPLIAPSRNP